MWTPALAEEFSVLPEHMERLRPKELNAMRRVLREKDKAARDAARQQR